MNLKLIVGASLGNAIEFLSLTLYSGFGTYIVKEFFPNAKALAIISIGIFCISYIARPLGAWLLGKWGDRKGRNLLLNFTIWGVGLANIGIACLPSYYSWGYASVFLLLFFRLVQGFCVGAEYSGAFIYVLETVQGNKKGVAGGCVGASCFWGMGLGLLCVNVLPEGSWRPCFFFVGLLAFVAVLMRYKNPESQEFLNSKSKEGLTRSWSKLWKVFLLACCDGLGTYLLCGFSLVFMHYFVDLPTFLVTQLSFVGVAVAAVMSMVSGHFADKFCPLGLLKKGLLAGSVVYPLIFSVLASYNNLFVYIAYFMVLASLAGWFVGLQPILGYRLVETHERLQVLATGYNGAMAVFGGLFPTLLTCVLSLYNSAYIPGVALSVVSLCLFGAVRASVKALPKNHDSK